MLETKHMHPHMRVDENIYPEGVVHGHIHNYDNMTYIHGHVHHNMAEANGNISTNKWEDCEVVPTAEQHMAAGGKNSGNLRNEADCQHFEIINYHRVNDTKKPVERRSSSFGSSLFNDDFLLLPARKRRGIHSAGYGSAIDFDMDGASNIKSNGEKSGEAENCECTPKILEVCCDVEHPNGSHSNEKDKNLIIYTDVQNDSVLQGALNSMGNHNELNIGNGNIQYANGKVAVPDINCDLTCGPYYKDSNRENETESEKEDEDIFEKFCQECLNLGLEQRGSDEKFAFGNQNHNRAHVHSHGHSHSHSHHHKCSFDTPLSTSSSSSNDGIKVENNFQSVLADNRKPFPSNIPNNVSQLNHTTSDTNATPNTNLTGSHVHACHDHIVNSQVDLKILDDLCNISSLYDFPLVNHLNHRNHSHEMTDSGNGVKTESINLVESSLRGITSQNQKSNQTHHHHIIQLHPHKSCCSATWGSPATGNIYDQNPANGNPINEQHFNSNFSNERSTIQEGTLNLNQNLSPSKFHHTQKSSDWNTVGQENNVINFNWSFKNEENNIKCKWDQCSETYPNLLDLQKHMLKEHVDANSTMNSSCYWEDCNFKGEDTCSLINHINADHGIKFAMKVVDPVSLLEQRGSVHTHGHYHQNHYNSNQHDNYFNDCGFTLSDNANLADKTKNIETLMSRTSLKADQKPSLLPRDQSLSGMSHMEDKKTELRCLWDDCAEVFESAEELTNHLEQFHLTRGKSTYQCHWKDCNKKFTQRQKLVRHLKVHSGYKPYKCSVCSKCFSSEDTLTQHSRIHSGEKPFECPICGKKFTVSSSLKIHIRTHTGEKPLQCKVCGKRFNESSNLSKHMKTHQKKYKCVYCARSFDTMDRLQGHQNKCTKLLEQK